MVQMCSSQEGWQCLCWCAAMSCMEHGSGPFLIPAPFFLHLLQHFLQLNHEQSGSLVVSSAGSSFTLDRFPIFSLPQPMAPDPHTNWFLPALS